MGPIEVKVTVGILSTSSPEVLAIVLDREQAPDPRRWVEGTERLYIDPSRNHDCFPVYLQFTANFPIVGVGFSPLGDQGEVPRYDRKGWSGGCFYLECDIDPTSQTTPLIRDDGPGTSPATGYHFMLWFKEGRAREGIDPQIYNEGVGEGRRWWRWLRRRP
jgi:hypothetical protein